MAQLPDPATPLEKFRLFRSRDPDEARSIVAGKFCDHRLQQMSRSDSFDAVHNRAEGRATSLNFIRYGAEVEIEPGELGSFYLIQIPLSGRARIDNSAGEVETGPGTGSVLNPHRHTAMRWRAGCAQLLLQVDANYLNRLAERLAGRSLSAPVTFRTTVDQRIPKVGAWVRRLKTCFTLADNDMIYGRDRLHTQALVEEQLVQDLLHCQPNDISGLLDDDMDRAGNVHVRRAIQHIRTHFDEPITLGEIADALGISPRSLQLGFKAELGQTPMQYLRETRLREARHLLANAGTSEKVGDICERVGFAHFGRFSVAYRQRFGESPHETLQRQG